MDPSIESWRRIVSAVDAARGADFEATVERFARVVADWPSTVERTAPLRWVTRLVAVDRDELAGIQAYTDGDADSPGVDVTLLSTLLDEPALDESWDYFRLFEVPRHVPELRLCNVVDLSERPMGLDDDAELFGELLRWDPDRVDEISHDFALLVRAAAERWPTAFEGIHTLRWRWAEHAYAQVGLVRPGEIPLVNEAIRPRRLELTAQVDFFDWSALSFDALRVLEVGDGHQDLAESTWDRLFETLAALEGVRRLDTLVLRNVMGFDAAALTRLLASLDVRTLDLTLDASDVDCVELIASIGNLAKLEALRIAQMGSNRNLLSSTVVEAAVQRTGVAKLRQMLGSDAG